MGQTYDPAIDYTTKTITCVGTGDSNFTGTITGRKLVSTEAGVTTPFTVTAADSGKVFLSGVAEQVFQLPATAAGLTYTFVVGIVSVVTGVGISPVAADLIGDNADDTDWVNTQATEAVGDNVTVVANGTTGWIVTAQRGVWT